MQGEQHVSLGAEVGGFFTAGKGYGLKVIVKEETVLFTISGDRIATANIPSNLIIPVVGALDLAGTGLFGRKEVASGLYVEKGRTFGRVRIRVRKPDGDKVFTEIPAFEASSVASYILSRIKMPMPIRYGIMDYYVEIEEVKEERKVIVRAISRDGAKGVVMDVVGFSKLLYAMRNAVLGGLYMPVKIAGVIGYVSVQEFIETEEEGKEEEVWQTIQDLTKAASIKNVPPLPIIKEALKKKGIPFKHLVRLRFGEGRENENRIEVRLPLAHAWGFVRVGETLIKSQER